MESEIAGRDEGEREEKSKAKGEQQRERGGGLDQTEKGYYKSFSVQQQSLRPPTSLLCSYYSNLLNLLLNNGPATSQY